MAELLNCPFCGGHAVLDPFSDPGGEYFVYCSGHKTGCRCDLGRFDSKAEAIAAWNRRSTVIPAEVAKVVAALRTDIEAHELTGNGGMKRVQAMREAATLIERLAASQAETRRLALEEVEAQAEQIMLDVANEWHRQVGIDEVLKSKLVKRIADTVATGVFSKRIRALIDQPITEGGKDGK